VSKPDILLESFYPHDPARVWRALTDPDAMADWLMPTEGFAPIVGTKFRFRTRPQPGWDGLVDCEVLTVDEPRRLVYSWIGTKQKHGTIVTWTLLPEEGGTRLRLEHTGFRGVGGFFLQWMLGSGWKKMLKTSFPEVLSHVDATGYRRPAGGTAHGRKVACAH
jgi:uncharacterized protein YndB with AHSA1/START domain